MAGFGVPLNLKVTCSRVFNRTRFQRLSASRVSQTRHYSPIRALQDAFRDPSSPYHLAPGTHGPAHPEDHGLDLHNPVMFPHRDPQIAETARKRLVEMGYDATSFWEQEIVWGDHDSFQHVNNVRYVRFFESGRIQWMTSLGHELGGSAKAEAMLKGKGISLIVKSISVNYKRPVTFPDTLLIAHKPHHGPMRTTSSTKAGDSSNAGKPGDGEVKTGRGPSKTHMYVQAAAYSYAQGRIVTESDSVLVWYDYDRLTKSDPGEDMRKIIERRMGLGVTSRLETLEN